jgi:sulfite reductase beta subunit-like hemoprotein
VRHNGTLASLRVVNIAEDLDLVSLTQILAWDLPLTKKIRDQIARQARESNFGSVNLVEKVNEKAVQRNSGKAAAKTADVMLRYNFPGGGLTDDALRTLILLVLDTGAEMRDALTG